MCVWGGEWGGSREEGGESRVGGDRGGGGGGGDRGGGGGEETEVRAPKEAMAKIPTQRRVSFSIGNELKSIANN